jgi:hypothetical protein
MKIYTLLIILFISGNYVLAQTPRINVYSAYVFDDHIESYASTYDYYEGEITGGYQWGAGLEFFVRPLYSLELYYQRQDTHAPIGWQSGSSVLADFEDFNMDINYIMLGSNRYVTKRDGKLETYGGLLIGMAIVDVENESQSESASITKFSWGGRLGCNIWASEKVAVKLQAQLLSVVQAAGGSAYFGTSGAGAGVSTYSTIYQFSLGGGLSFKVGDEKPKTKQ